jgi:hypothetical protein
VTARPVFGEFLDAARDQLGGSAGVRGVAGRDGNVQEVIDGLLRVVTVMGRYMRDVTAAAGELGSRVRPPLTAWGRAGMDARSAGQRGRIPRIPQCGKAAAWRGGAQ